MPFTDRSSAAARLGQALDGRFRLDEVLESDVLAHTYLASDSAAERAVVSILQAELGGAPGIASHFVRGAHVASMIGRGVPAVRGAGLTPDGFPFVVFERVARETLHAFLLRRRGRIAPMEGLRIAAAALDVLGAAHDRALFHGELSPRRILLDELGNVYVSGFGWGKLRERAAAHFGLACVPNTAAYFSPEQARTRAASESGDVWAVAAILFELLSGRPLREATTEEKRLSDAASRPAPSLAFLNAQAPGELVALLERALDLNAARRFNSAIAFSRACTLVAGLPNPWFWQQESRPRFAPTEPALAVPGSASLPLRGPPPRTSIVAPRPGSVVPPGEAQAVGDSARHYVAPTPTGMPPRPPPRSRS
jgi:serine/threonine-protein kinase